MTLSTMRYKGYKWQHNPASLTVTTKGEIKEQRLLQKQSIVNDLGSNARVIKGTGQLVGKDCITQYCQLLRLQSKGGSGVLSLPDTLPFYAFFKSIELSCDPTPEVVTYNFEFVEDLSSEPIKSQSVYCTVENGETLWDISYKYDISIEKLVELNPQISRVDELALGEQVRIC